MQAALASGQRRALPLAVTAGVHLLLAGLWMVASTRPPKAGEAQPALRMLWLRPTAPKPQPAPPLTQRSARPAARRALPSDSVQATAPPVVEPASAPLQADPDPAPRPGASALLAAARQAAGAVDRELRANKLAPLQGDGAWGRFARQLAAAKTGNSRSVVTETYVAPDGTITYRTRNGDRVYCRRSGGVAPGLEPTQGHILATGGASGGLSTAGNVRCPSQDPGFRP